VSDFATRLVDSGMTASEAAAKQQLFARACAALDSSRAGAFATFAVFVPGRIEVLGKHTDYAGGRSLLCAVERGICLVARPRPDGVVRAHDTISGTTVSVPALGPADASSDNLNPAEARSRDTIALSWAVYVSTVAGRLARNFPDARRGADIALASDLPMAAGMSSSSALVTSLLIALAALNDLPSGGVWRANITTREDLAEYLGTVENGQDFRALAGDAGVGTFGGSEDHTAMLCCRAGELSQYSFCPVRHERQIRMPAGYEVVVAVSGVAAEKTGAARHAYNDASAAARQVLVTWNRATGRQDTTLRAAVESGLDATERIRALLPGSGGLRQRFDQFVEETFVIVPKVGDLVSAGRLDLIGDLVDRSQAGAEHGLRNQVPETIFLARSARQLGAAAASAFGAGFGGSVWALVAHSSAEEFSARWSERYRAAFPQHADRAQFFATTPGPAAVEMRL